MLHQYRDVCGSCRLLYFPTSTSPCQCEGRGERTQSFSSILSNDVLFPDPTRRHGCVFVYIPYLRWVPSGKPKEYETREDKENAKLFSEACLPPWAGWYAAWLDPQPLRIIRPRPLWSEVDVLRVKVHFYDGTYLDGFLDSKGHLILEVSGPRPPRNMDYDELRNLVRVRAEVTQALTWKEIIKSSRGTVHSGTGIPNGGRKVWYIVGKSDSNEDEVVARLLPQDEGDEGKLVNVRLADVQKIAPYLLHEFQRRCKRRFEGPTAWDIQFSVMKLFARARENDGAVRYALGRRWLNTVPSVDEILSQISDKRSLFLMAFSKAKAAARVEEERKRSNEQRMDVDAVVEPKAASEHQENE
ncbi:hypothetical protein FGB62_163g062 [Gracilaria domingensis]|nr:hypothetical protein FGB62_163g062 [Gracilaria domingensis]